MGECLVEVGLRAVDGLSLRHFGHSSVKQRVGFLLDGVLADVNAYATCTTGVGFSHLLQLTHCLLLGQLDTIFCIFDLVVKLVPQHRI